MTRLKDSTRELEESSRGFKQSQTDELASSLSLFHALHSALEPARFTARIYKSQTTDFNLFKWKELIVYV